MPCGRGKMAGQGVCACGIWGTKGVRGELAESGGLFGRVTGASLHNYKFGHKNIFSSISLPGCK